jgi:hypothetical protein
MLKCCPVKSPVYYFTGLLHRAAFCFLPFTLHARRMAHGTPRSALPGLPAAVRPLPSALRAPARVWVILRQGIVVPQRVTPATQWVRPVP